MKKWIVASILSIVGLVVLVIVAILFYVIPEDSPSYVFIILLIVFFMALFLISRVCIYLTYPDESMNDPNGLYRPAPSVTRYGFLMPHF